MKKLCLSLALIICVGIFVYAISPATSAEEGKITESGDYLLGVPERTTVADFKKLYTRSGFSVFDKDNKTLPENALLATGCKLCYEREIGDTAELTVIIAGDTDGNGKVTTTDYIAIKNHLVNNNLGELAKLAADVDGYGVSTSDYMKVKLHFEGRYDLYGGILIPDESTDDSSVVEEPDEPWTSGWA